MPTAPPPAAATRRATIASALLAALLAPSALATDDAAHDATAPRRPNILLICVDDLRAEDAGAPRVAPSLDRLAREGRRFTRHYVQVPTCGASRFSMLTGRRPSSHGDAARAALGNDAFRLLRDRPADERAPTLPERLRRAGYRTVGIGKISHHPDGRWIAQNGSGDGAPEMPDAWDAMLCPTGHHETPWRAFFAYADGRGRTPGVSPPIERADVPDDRYPDALLADEAIARLAELGGDAARETPFLLAVGFFKPHLPFAAPRRWFDLVPEDGVGLAPRTTRPEGAPDRAMHASAELLGNYGGHPEGGIDEAYARRLRQGYYAALAYADAQLGRVLDALDASPARDHTIVIVWGDHGWHLGDQGLWGKHSLFERALRSELIVRTPAIPRAGSPTHGIVESVDLVPTLLELAGLPVPPDLSGASFAPQLRDPDAPGKTGALADWKGGRTLRTERYRITEWPEGTAPRVELYDHEVDPEESRNVAADHPDVVAEWTPSLRAESSRRRETARGD